MIEKLKIESGENTKPKEQSISDGLQAIDSSIISHMDYKTRGIVLEEQESDIKKN